MNMYETSVKVPGIFAWPGHIPQGVVSQTMVSHYDFMPTLLEMCRRALSAQEGAARTLLCPRADGRERIPSATRWWYTMSTAPCA